MVAAAGCAADGAAALFVPCPQSWPQRPAPAADAAPESLAAVYEVASEGEAEGGVNALEVCVATPLIDTAVLGKGSIVYAHECVAAARPQCSSVRAVGAMSQHFQTGQGSGATAVPPLPNGETAERRDMGNLKILHGARSPPGLGHSWRFHLLGDLDAAQCIAHRWACLKPLQAGIVWHVEEILQAASCEHSAGPDYQANQSA